MKNIDKTLSPAWSRPLPRLAPPPSAAFARRLGTACCPGCCPSGWRCCGGSPAIATGCRPRCCRLPSWSGRAPASCSPANSGANWRSACGAGLGPARRGRQRRRARRLAGLQSACRAPGPPHLQRPRADPHAGLDPAVHAVLRHRRTAQAGGAGESGRGAGDHPYPGRRARRPAQLREAAAVLRLPPRLLVWRLILPAALPAFLTGCAWPWRRVGPRCWRSSCWLPARASAT